MTALRPSQNPSSSVSRTGITSSLIAGVFASSQAIAAVSLAPSLTTGVQTFASTPPAADWSTVSLAGAAGTLASVAAVDSAVQALAATGITTVLGTQAATAANALAQRSSTGTSFIYTAATGNNATVLMSTLQNDSGGPVAAISISYAYTRIGTAVEESMGHRAFYSLTGLANSWTLIPGLSNIATNQTLTTSATLSTPWANGAKLYLLWADDNGSGSDGPFTIDDFSVTSINPPPVVNLTSPANGTITSLPGTFELTATATDDGSVTQVEFLRDGVVVNTDTSVPYAYTDSGLAVGTYTYTARATDNSAGTSLSTPSTVTVFTNAANTALAFDGVNDCVTMGAATSTLGASTFTLECWFKRSGTGVTTSTGTNGLTSVIPLVTKGRGEGDATATTENTQDCNYFLGIDSATNKLCADFEAKLGTPLNGTGATNNNYPVFGSTVITNNVWYHAAATWENGGWKLYINGVLETMTIPNLIPSPAPIPQSGSIQHFGIATAMDTAGVRAGFFQGTIDEVRVWNLARSAGEIAAGKNLEITSGTGLIGRYGLNEALGTSASNSIGVPAGTLSNGPVWVDGAPFVANVPPTVALTAPLDESSVLSGSIVSFAASASDSDGTVSKVEFYQGATKLGEDGTAPYTFDWTASTVGDFTLTAKAIDNNAASTTSAAVTLHVTQNSAPLIALTAPADESSLVAPASSTLTASASDSDGSISKVEFFNGATKLGEDLADPYSYDWTGIAMGDYALTAKATDELGLVTTSAVITLHVTPPVTTPPTVALTAPADEADFVFPANINLAATANDADGSVAKVEFFNGATKLGEDSTAPYEYTWSGAAIGDHTITAKATDDMTATTTSAAISVHVLANQPPVVTQDAPANNATGIGTSTNLDLSIADPEAAALTVNYYGRRTTPATPGADFSIATLPDTQYYSENLSNNGRSATFLAQTQWLVDNRNSLNLAFVSHLGDIVQNGDSVPAEWVVADTAMKKIESQIDTLRVYGIPWGAAPGNHDQTGIAGAGGANSLYNQYFPASRYAGRNYWGGSQSPSNNHNNYQLFSVSGLDFMIIHLEYDTRSKSSYQTVLDWADALMKAHPDRRAIVTSHWSVNTGNPATFSNQGQNIYDDLKDNPNFFMMLGGHVPGEGRRTDSFEGRAVHSLLQDYQGRTNGGDGWLRYFIFSPAANTITAKTYRVSNPVNPAAGAFETDADSEFTLAYPMQSPVTAWIPLGSVNVPAGGTTASLPWTGLEAGKDYEWYATVNDSVNTATTPARRFSTAVNAAPTVSITAPLNNASLVAPAAFTLTADAADGDGSIARVEFYQGNTKLGEDSAAPYEQAVSGLAVGSYAFSAVAVDNSTAATLSAVVNVTVNSGLPPEVAITGPLAEASFDALAAINIIADASDSDGTVSKVEFFQGATKLGEDSSAPYTFNWTGVISGAYSLTAKATDSAANTTTSAAVAITVTNADNAPPAVAITAPVNGATIAAGSTLNITATASDTDGTISKVEFYQGATKLGEDTSAPYAYSWASVPLGTYSLTAVAIDNDAGTNTSAAVSVTAEPAPWSYTQNFDGLGTTGTSITALSGWNAGHFNPFVQQGTTGGNGLVTVTDPLTVDNGGAGTGTTPFLLNLGTTGSTDRALGSFARTTPAGDQFLQVAITNDSGAPITSFVLSYKGEQWRNSTTPVQQLTMWFGNTNASNGFSAMPAFTFNSPNNTGGNTAIDGNAAGNFALITGTYVPASPIAAGSTFYLRWYDINDNGIADDYLAIDDLSITLPVGQSPVATLTAPANGSVHYVGGTINLAATASDSDGTISKVEFYQGATKLGEDSTDPYTYAWSGYSAGSYSLTAKAIDNNGNITASAASTINVYAATGSGTLTRGPYLNSGSHNQIVIRWRSSQSVVGRVRYGTSTANLDQTVDETIAKTDHEVKLTGLVPYTRYYYSVGSAFDALTPQVAEITSYTPGAPAPTAADYTFRTSPTPGTAVDTRIWIVGDCGRGTQVQANGRDAYYSYNGSASFTGTRIPDLNLQMGDNAYNSGTDAEYTTGYYNMYANIFRKMPQWSCLGNHDANNGSTSTTANFPYFDMFTFPTAGECGGVASGTERYYSFNYGNIHFICLDSQASLTTVDNPATTGVNEDGPMATWLRADLAANTATWTIAFWHHPPYSKGSHNSDTESQLINMRTNFNPILEAGGVDLLYFGHSHNYERSFLLDNSTKMNSGNGSVSGFTTASSGKIRNAANGFTATATVNGVVTPGDGAYIKPLTGPRDHFGAVYNTAGMSGLADAGAIDHPVMHICYNSVGTVNLDVNGNTLTSTFVQSGGATPDNFTITKQGAADTDHDGIPDEYEIANGLNRYVNDAGTTDTDGDGTTNMSEFILGQSANVPDQYGWTTTTDPFTGNVTVNFPTLAGRTYRVLYSQSLIGWMDGSGVVTGDGTTKNWTDDGTSTGTAPAVTPKRFYRVMASTVDP